MGVFYQHETPYFGDFIIIDSLLVFAFVMFSKAVIGNLRLCRHMCLNLKIAGFTCVDVKTCQTDISIKIVTHSFNYCHYYMNAYVNGVK